MDWALRFLQSQLFIKLPVPTSSFSGQTVIVTGSNTGLGLEAARHIVRLGASKVILAVRTVSKGEAAARSILETTKATANTIEVWQLDLSSYDSVKAFGARMQTLDRLDAFLQNAGILSSKFGTAEDNEAHITVNVISATLLGLFALPKLRETSAKYGVRTRLELVGSDLQWVAKFKEADTSGSLLDALAKKDGVDMGDRYPVSKLLLLYTVRELAARSPLTKTSNVIIDCVTPGACQSDIFRDDMSWLQAVFHKIMFALVARTTEVGSRALVHGVKPDLEDAAHGAFLQDCRVYPNGPNIESARGRKLQKRWIEELLQKLESLAPGVTAVIS